MRAEYKRDLQRNYLILEGEEETGEEDYRVQMAERNKIPGLLPFHRSRTDGVLRLYYEITGKQPLSGLYEKKPLSCSDIFLILTGINETLDNLQKFLLGPEQLVFSPEYIFMDPNDRRVQLCYAPGIAIREPISKLAEFILKRLDHQDGEAVALGYFFYQKIQEENFSLQAALRESLQRSAKQKEEKASLPYDRQLREPMSSGGASDGEEEEVLHKGRGQDPYSPRELWEGSGEKNPEAEKASREKKGGFVNWLFEKIHPAVLLSSLFLLAVLEIVFYLRYLRLTEAGGAFFLILSAEMLANSRWRKRRAKKEAERLGRWAKEEQEESEAFSSLKEEMYEGLAGNAYVEETRCLADLSPESGIRLELSHGPGGGTPGQRAVEEIILERGAMIVGKLEGQCDVLLSSSTVSRVHARLERRGGRYFVKDLNSRNGTFLNGERLEPQEEREFFRGDGICFAEIGYRAR